MRFWYLYIPRKEVYRMKCVICISTPNTPNQEGDLEQRMKLEPPVWIHPRILMASWLSPRSSCLLSEKSISWHVDKHGDTHQWKWTQVGTWPPWHGNKENVFIPTPHFLLFDVESNPRSNQDAKQEHWGMIPKETEAVLDTQHVQHGQFCLCQKT